MLAKRDTPSWNEQDPRGDRPRAWRCRDEPRFFTADEFATVDAIAAASCRSRRTGRRFRSRRWSITSCIDGPGGRLPARRHAARARGLAARPARARRRGASGATARAFPELRASRAGRAARAACRRATLQRPGLGRHAARDLLQATRWRTTSCAPTTPIPTAWNEIGWGGPASPRGYVRMGYDERDPWEAAEAQGRRRREPRATEEPPCRMIRCAAPRAQGRPRARRVPPRRLGADAGISRGRGGRFRHRRHRRGRRHAGLQAGRSTASRSWRSMPARISGRWRISPPTRSEQTKLYWTDDRIVDGDNPLQLGSNNSGKAVGGSTVHFAMVSLRFRPEWFKSRTPARLRRRLAARLARDVATTTREVEQALKIAGPVTYPWGPHAAALSLSRARAERRRAGAGRGLRGAGHRVDARRRSPRCRRRAGRAHPCVYRGFCTTGCSTNAKQSALVTWIPRAHRGRRGNPRPRHGRPDRDGRRRPRHRRALSPRRPLALPARAQRGRRGLRDRDAAAAAELGDRRVFRTGSPTAPAWSART